MSAADPIRRPSARAARRPTAPAARLRLTRRGRLVVVVAVLVALLAGTVAFGPMVLATGGAGDPVDVRMVTVQPGQTLWEIAVAADPAGDPRDAVHEIEQLNDLDGAELQIGQRLEVPVTDCC